MEAAVASFKVLPHQESYETTRVGQAASGPRLSE
jgi:hypothetical protein